MTLKNVIDLGDAWEKKDEPLIKMQEKIDSFFDAFFPEVQMLYGITKRFPAITVSESGSSIIVQAELANMTANDVVVTLHKNRLLIKGDKKSTIEELEHEDEKETPNTYHVNEITYGKFARSLALPFDINPTKTRASFFNGILTVTIEKSEAYRYRSTTIPIISED